MGTDKPVSSSPGQEQGDGLRMGPEGPGRPGGPEGPGEYAGALRRALLR